MEDHQHVLMVEGQADLRVVVNLSAQMDITRHVLMDQHLKNLEDVIVRMEAPLLALMVTNLYVLMEQQPNPVLMVGNVPVLTVANQLVLTVQAHCHGGKYFPRFVMMKVNLPVLIIRNPLVLMEQHDRHVLINKNLPVQTMLHQLALMDQHQKGEGVQMDPAHKPARMEILQPVEMGLLLVHVLMERN